MNARNIDWEAMLDRTQRIARHFAGGHRHHNDGTSHYVGPVAPWLRAGIAAIGVGRKTAADGSVIADAVQDAMVTTLRQAKGVGTWAGKDSLTADELAMRAGSRACNHIQRWNEKPGRFLPNPGGSEGVGAPVPLTMEQAVQELETKSARVEESALQFQEELAALLAKLPDTCRGHARILIDWIAATGKTAFDADCPLQDEQVRRLMAAVAAVLLRRAS